MEAVKLAECSPKHQQSAKPFTLNRETCEKCKKQVERVYSEMLNRQFMRVCKTCVPLIRAEQKGIVAEGRAKKLIPPLYQSARLEHLALPLQAKIRNLPPDKGLLLWGETGVGKSYAMAAIMRHLIFQDREVTRTTYELLCLEIRDTYKAGSTKTEQDVIRPLIDVDRLFIEDVGTTVSTGRQESDFSLRTFLVLLDHRLENCRPTFITTNKNIEELSKSFDQRIGSRLRQACEVIHLTGPDRRIPETERTKKCQNENT